MNTNKIIAGYKLRNQLKIANAVDQIIYGIARAYRAAESEGEAGYLAGKYVLKAFKATTNKNKLQFNQNHDAFYTLNRYLHLLSHRIPEYWKSELDPEDTDQIKAMAKRLSDLTTRHYLYIFVRQDICAEQQAVQAAHATFVAGAAIRADHSGNAKRAAQFNPNHTHFVLLGVPTLKDLWDVRDLARDSNIMTHPFYEGDLNEEMTAFTTGIITQENRHLFAGFNLLKFGEK